MGYSDEVYRPNICIIGYILMQIDRPSNADGRNWFYEQTRKVTHVSMDCRCFYLSITAAIFLRSLMQQRTAFDFSPVRIFLFCVQYMPQDVTRYYVCYEAKHHGAFHCRFVYWLRGGIRRRFRDPGVAARACTTSAEIHQDNVFWIHAIDKINYVGI